jgi:hypothetical protein
MKITIVKYPKTFSFETDKKLPRFKYGCDTRTSIVQDELSKIRYKAPHAPEDFIVESIDETPDGEIWEFGS